MCKVVISLGLCVVWTDLAAVLGVPTVFSSVKALNEMLCCQ